MNAHPSIDLELLKRWRLIKNGGDDFVEEFLARREKEDPTSFSTRRGLTYDPATASSAIDDVINSLAARLDVSRTGGSAEYQDIVAGNMGGVDKNGSSMNDFLIKETIPELCFMGKTCWLIQNFTDDSDLRKVPYIVQHTAEQMFNWAYRDGQLTAFAVKFPAAKINPDTGFMDDEVDVIRAFKLTDSGVETWLQDESDVELDPITLEAGTSRTTLNLTKIPVVVFSLPVALLSKIDKMQIAMLNLESADIEWLRVANITLYIEQGNGFPNSSLIKSTDDTEEEDAFEVTLGSKNGRRYGLGMNPPAFISPPADPIRTSMEKQKQIETKTKEILKATMASMSLASAESIQLLGQGMESCLFIIGTVLKLGEDQFADTFHEYLNRADNDVTVSYPKKYELRTEAERHKKVREIKDLAKTVGSNTAKKYLEIDAVKTLLDGRVPYADMQTIEQEIRDSEFCIYDPETVTALVESGIISHQLASKSLGAPDTDYAAAEEEHIRRIVAVQVSQTSGTGSLNPDPAFTEKVRKEAAVDVPTAN